MLVIVLEDSTATPPLERRWTLECGPASGDLPNAESACERLAALEDPWAPVPADVACAEIFAGPQTVAVTGSFDGEAVDASFSRNNACETERFDRVATALGITLS